jgi:hypothetical protein
MYSLGVDGRTQGRVFAPTKRDDVSGSQREATAMVKKVNQTRQKGAKKQENMEHRLGQIQSLGSVRRRGARLPFIILTITRAMADWGGMAELTRPSLAH